MDNKLENRLTMYEGLLALLQENDAKAQTRAGFAKYAKEFTEIVADIRAKSIERDNASTGKTEAKNRARGLLEDDLMNICSALYVCGEESGKTEISEKNGITSSFLGRMRDTELGLFGTDIAVMAEANSAALIEQGVTQEEIGNIRARAEEFNKSIGSKESGVTNRKGARGAMEALFDKADDLLVKRLDKLVELFRTNEAEFYNKYFEARAIKETGIRHRASEAAVAQAGA